jgi:sugar (pentulose or hexulose) kinase
VLPGCVVVLDVGKTLTKLSLFAEEGQLIVQRSYQNRVVEFEGRHWLDTEGIDRWVRQTLQEFTQLRSIAAIVPIGHGAAAGLIRDDALVCPIPDYEDIVEPALRTEQGNVKVV